MVKRKMQYQNDYSKSEYANRTDNSLMSGLRESQMEFKGIDLDYYVHLAILQCLSAAINNHTLYSIAVQNLDSTLKYRTERDEEFKKEIREKLIALSAEAHIDEWSEEFAVHKFQALMKFLARSQPEDRVGLLG
jgi:hypothetical protein